MTGLGAIIKTSELIFNGIKYAGAAYLVYMGLRLFHAKGLQLNAFQDQVMTSHVPSRSIYFQAVGVAVSNPKAIVFLTALFPQFLNINSPLVPQFLMLIITLMTFSFLFLMSYALMAHKAKTWLFRANRVRAVSRLSGTVFIGFGILLATSSNK